MKITAYCRVSTAKQGASGLGLEAQKSAIQAYARQSGAEIIADFVEVESGRRNDREELQKALKHAKLTGSKLVISTLSRLARNAAFLLSLQESGVDFVCCDMPNANSTTIGFMAIMAQAEAEQTSVRVTAALAAAKARGIRLGNPNGAAALRRANKGNTDALSRIKGNADAFAIDLADILADVRANGHTTLQAQAAELNRRGIKTARQRTWHASSVANIHSRLANMGATQ